MNDKMQFPFWNTDWMNSGGMNSQPDWFQNQRQYMDAWSSFQNFMPNSSSGINPMYEAMNSWWNNASPSLSGQNYDFYNKMMQQGKSFYFMGEQFNKLLNGMNDVNRKSNDWQKVLNEQFDAMKSAFVQSETLQDSFTTAPFTTAPFLQADFQKDYLKVFDILTNVEKYSPIPGVGSTRESQEQIQEGIRLMGEYQEVSHDFNIVMSKVGVEAMEVMRLMIIEMAERDEEIKSLREMYDLWVDCNEKAYADYVTTDEYSELYGRLSNALMAVKQHYGKLMDKLLSKLNLPTRRGRDTILKRLQEMKRDQSKSVTKIAALEAELQALRQMIEGKKGTSSPAAAGSSTKSKKAKKKAKKKMSKKTAKKTSSDKPIVIDI
jgi:class III poly(R)-hydroxyalkanoic acid synthase PhaE subunit